MRIIGWNVENTHAPDAVRAAVEDLIAAHHPDVLCLQETYHLHGHLLDLGYRVVQFAPRKGVSEHAEVTVMVRDGLKIKGRLSLWLRARWRGPKAGRMHDPRIYRYVRLLDADGTVWKVGSIHQPFGHGPQAESIVAVQGWFDRAKPGRPCAMVGDWNERRDVVAKRLHGVKVIGSGIDLAAMRNCRGKSTRLGQHGSDHHAIRYDLTEESR